jgi:hypothetical protein
MPRRRVPRKDTREIPILLRDAQLILKEQGDQRALSRARTAKNAMMRMYRDARARGELDQLDFRIRTLCEKPLIIDYLKEHPQAGAEEIQAYLRSNPPLPKLKVGRSPGAQARRLEIAIKIDEEIEAREARGEKGATEKALQGLAGTVIVKPRASSYEYLKEICYDPDPGWRLGVKAERAFRAEYAIRAKSKMAETDGRQTAAARLREDRKARRDQMEAENKAMIARPVQAAKSEL